MAKKRKGLRRYFYRRKNDIRKSRTLRATQTLVPKEGNSILSSKAPQMSPMLQQPNIDSAPQMPSVPDASLLDRTHPNATFAVLCEQAAEQLDSSWKMTQSDQSIQFYILQCERAQPTITRSVTINVDLSWSVYVRGRQLVSYNTSILSNIPEQISSVAF